MQVSRRGFLRSLAVAAAGMTIDPERLLWRPGEKTIVVMNGNPFWTSHLATSDRVLTFEMLREAIEAIEAARPLPLQLTTSLEIKINYERLLRDDAPTIPLVRATNNPARGRWIDCTRLTY